MRVIFAIGFAASLFSTETTAQNLGFQPLFGFKNGLSFEQSLDLGIRLNLTDDSLLRLKSDGSNSFEYILQPPSIEFVPLDFAAKSLAQTLNANPEIALQLSPGTFDRISFGNFTDKDFVNALTAAQQGEYFLNFLRN